MLLFRNRNVYQSYFILLLKFAGCFNYHHNFSVCFYTSLTFSMVFDVVIVTKVCQILKKTITTFKTAVIEKYKKKYVKVILLHIASLIYVHFFNHHVCSNISLTFRRVFRCCNRLKMPSKCPSNMKNDHNHFLKYAVFSQI